MKRDGQTYTFSTGRSFSANRGIIGLVPDERDPIFSRVYEGYDGDVDCARMEQGGDDDQILTKDERIELASHMITEWAKWAGIPYCRWGLTPGHDVVGTEHHLENGSVQRCVRAGEWEQIRPPTEKGPGNGQ